jgi:DNA primase
MAAGAAVGATEIPHMPKSKFPKFSDVQAKASFPAVLKHYRIAFTQMPSGELRALCPFHEDKSPSMFINIEKRLFNCFGCGAGGNVVEFVRLKETLSDTGSDLGKAASLVMDVSGAGDGYNFVSSSGEADVRSKPARAPVRPEKGIAKEEERVGAAVSNEPLGFELQLELGSTFLSNRGIDAATQEMFGLGVAKRGMMKDRVVIPIHNGAGEMVAYCGRYAGDPVPEVEPRYKMPATFNKRLELFNLHRAVALDRDFVVLVEGFWSAIRLHMLGIPTVASMGAQLYPEQVDLIVAAGFTRAFVVFDGDTAGRIGAEKAVASLSGHMFTRRLDLPDGIKPDAMDQGWLDVLI